MTSLKVDEDIIKGFIERKWGLLFLITGMVTTFSKVPIPRISFQSAEQKSSSAQGSLAASAASSAAAKLYMFVAEN